MSETTVYLGVDLGTSRTSISTSTGFRETVWSYVGYPKERKVLDLCVTFPDDSPTGMLHLTAKEAVYVPATGAPQTGGWKLFQTTPEAVFWAVEEARVGNDK